MLGIRFFVSKIITSVTDSLVKKIKSYIRTLAWKDKQTTMDANADLNYLVAKLWCPRNWKTEIFGWNRLRVYVFVCMYSAWSTGRG